MNLLLERRRDYTGINRPAADARDKFTPMRHLLRRRAAADPVSMLAAALIACAAVGVAADRQRIAQPPPTARTTAAAPISSYRIVKIHPHDREAFTEGLFFQDGA